MVFTDHAVPCEIIVKAVFVISLLFIKSKYQIIKKTIVANHTLEQLVSHIINMYVSLID